MFTDYIKVEHRIIPRNYIYSAEAVAPPRIRALEEKLGTINPEFNLQLKQKINTAKQEINAQRAANIEVKPGSQAHEVMKSIQSQMFEVHKTDKKKTIKTINPVTFKLLDSVKKVFAIS